MSNRRRTAALLLACCLIPAGCTSAAPAADPGPPPSPSIAAFAAAWQTRQAATVAALTTDPDTAGQEIGNVLSHLAPTALTVVPGAVQQTSPGKATATAAFDWTLAGGVRWKYTASWSFTRAEKSRKWRADWASTVINPQLGEAQTLVFRKQDATDGTLLDRSAQPILEPVTVYSVVALPGKIGDPAKAGAALAKILGPLDPTVTAASVVAGVKAAPPSVGYTVTNLRDVEYQKVRSQLDTVPGLAVPSAARNLPPTKNFAKVLLSQVEPVAAKMSVGTPGWEIDSIDATGADLDTLASQPARPGANVTLTLDSTVQKAAETALASVPEPAMIVALQPSTGEILAVAQNQPANAQGALALTGEYPPGSTFKIVTATAGFDNRLVTPTTAVDCPGVVTVDNRDIHNEGFELGTVPLTTAFARSCNTTFAALATRMPAGALTAAAAEYGIGRDFVIPGITTLTGKVPVADSTVQKAEDGFGQGVVLVTPFSAALMAATAATGNMPTPTLIRGTKTTIDQPAPARSALTRSGIRTLMRAVVTDGTAKVLQGDGTVYAKTGTADYTDPKGVDRAHAWTVGFRGDLAFSVLIVGGDSSKRTNLVADAFLRAVPAS